MAEGSKTRARALTPPEEAAPLFAEEDRRYDFVALAGEGGVGKVVACRDRVLGRQVALKVSRNDTDDADAMVTREARILARLDHPNIVPIYDLANTGHSSYYSMRLLEQPTLLDIIIELERGSAKVTHGRALRMFIQVCDAVAYAHSRGVVHCDLKPDNVLIGSYGEVTVVDWGFALRIGDDGHERGGTAGFMPPEQLDKGGQMDERTDVFALGVMLFMLLTGERPFADVDFERWRSTDEPFRADLLAFEAPSLTASERNIPESLDRLCIEALRLDKEQRLPTATDLARGLDRFLEGQKEKKRRRRHANELCDQANMIADSHIDLVRSRPERVYELARLRARTAPWDTGEGRAAIVDAEDGVSVLDGLANRAALTAVSLYERALDESADHKGARRGLAKLYWALSEQAERRRDALEQKHYEQLALLHDQGFLRAHLEQGGTVEFETEGFSSVEVFELETIESRLVDGELCYRHDLPPPAPLALPSGSYVAVLDGRVRAPLLVRSGHASVVRADARHLAPGTHDEIFVPGGEALIGGHATSFWGDELQVVEVPPFVIRRRHVLFSEYLDFLAACRAEKAQAPLAFEAALPRDDFGDPLLRCRDGHFLATPGLLRFAQEDGWRALPAIGVSFRAAKHYARWLAKRSDLPWRLPTEPEWEKASRGVDGRPYPWGHRFDANLCLLRESQKGRPSVSVEQRVESDVSPYGLTEVAGYVADWVSPMAKAERTVSKGGAWCDWQADAHLGAHRRYELSETAIRVGFRLARTPRRRRSKKPDA